MTAIDYLYSEKRRLWNEIQDSVIFDDPVSVTERLADKLEKVELEIEELENKNDH